jgi:hypothetical protein
MTRHGAGDDRQAPHVPFDQFSEQGSGLALGVLAALSLFTATIVLVLKGGPIVGPHLGLLSAYFPGYRVTVLGAFIGAGYAFFLGYGAGRVLATIYNRIVRRR